MTDSSTSEDIIPVLPLRDTVVFPHMIVPLFVGREKSVKALENVMEESKNILLLTQKEAGEDDPGKDDLYSVGVIGKILQLLKLPDGTVKVLVEGVDRVSATEFFDKNDYLEAKVATHEKEEDTESEELVALARAVATQFEQYVKLNKKIPPEVIVSVNQIEEPPKLADTVASHLTLSIEEKQEILELSNTLERLEKIYAFMEGEMDVLQVEKRVRSRVKRQMEKKTDKMRDENKLTQKTSYLSRLPK